MVPASPWSQIVRGGESESVSSTSASPSSPKTSPEITVAEESDRSPRNPEVAAPEMAEADGTEGESGGCNAARGKKPAWNVPPNGALESGPVMGAESWPALSESARASPRSSSEPPKVPSDGSASSTLSQAHMITSSPQISNSINANPSLSSNHAIPVRPRTPKRGGGPFNNGTVASPPQPLAHMPQHLSDSETAAASQSSPRDHHSNVNNGDSSGEGGSNEHVAPQSHNGNIHPRNSYRRNGGGLYHNNHANRRRPNHEWNSHRNFSNRDGRSQHPRFVPRNFHIPPPVPPFPPVFVPTPIGGHYGPMGYSEVPPYYVYAPQQHLPPEPFRPVQHPPPMPPVIYRPPQDSQLRSSILQQIEYYFSNDNLCKDVFLRTKMDGQGWVPVALIASFNRVKHLTRDTQFILTCLQTSSVVEVNADKVRRRNDWMNWLLPQSQLQGHSNTEVNNFDKLTAHVQSLRLEGSSSG